MEMPEGIRDCVAEMLREGIPADSPWRDIAFRDIGAELRRLGMEDQEAVELVRECTEGWKPPMDPRRLQNGLRYIKHWVFEPSRNVPVGCGTMRNHQLCIHEGQESDCAFHRTKRERGNEVGAIPGLTAAWEAFLCRYYKLHGRVAVLAYRALGMKRAVEMLPLEAPVCLGFRAIRQMVSEHFGYTPSLGHLCAAVHILEDLELVVVEERGKPGTRGKALSNKYRLPVVLPKIPKPPKHMERRSSAKRKQRRAGKRTAPMTI